MDVPHSKQVHVLVVERQNLSLRVRVVDLVQTDRVLINKALELVGLARQLFVGVDLGHLEWVDHDPVVVDLTQEVGLSQVGPRNLIVIWQVVALAQATDSQVDVLDASVTVDEHQVLVHDPAVPNRDTKLDQESNEHANRT